MKFDPPIPSLAAPRSGSAQAIRFTLEQGDFAGRVFTGALKICSNPCCPCQLLHFDCQSDPTSGSPEAAPSAAPAAPLHFQLKVIDRAVDPTAKSSPEARTLAKAVVAELQPADWEDWTQTFLATKRSQMKALDLDRLNAWLPPEVLDGAATMVGYAEVFPWVAELEFSLAEDTWFADDQYCVDPDCDCQEAVLSLFRKPRDLQRRSRPLGSECALRFDYVRGKFTVEERKYRSPEGADLLAALRAAHPDCAKTFRERHRQLKQLAKRLVPAVIRNSRRASGFRLKEFMDDKPPALTATPAPKPVVKPGRNDACPCGSGKKYKKCCGR